MVILIGIGMYLLCVLTIWFFCKEKTDLEIVEDNINEAMAQVEYHKLQKLLIQRWERNNESH